jgi:hypothetical protein
MSKLFQKLCKKGQELKLMGGMIFPFTIHSPMKERKVTMLPENSKTNTALVKELLSAEKA